ncbi:unnamed protein product, partial [Owenia fusiformis]
QYPAAHSGESAGCKGYDNRFRPWYVETATPEPKDVVIVLDKSKSMSNPISAFSTRLLIRVAKEASMTILETLNPSDRIGIVEFSTTASVAMGDPELTPTCFKNQLAFAIPQNIEILKRNVDKITVDENTNY